MTIRSISVSVLSCAMLLVSCTERQDDIPLVYDKETVVAWTPQSNQEFPE